MPTTVARVEVDRAAGSGGGARTARCARRRSCSRVDPVERLGVHLGVEQHRRADGVGLGAVERDLGLLEQVERLVRSAACRSRCPRLAPTETSVPSRSNGAPSGGLDPDRHALRLADAADRAQQDPELVRAEPRDGVGRTGRPDQPPADLGEEQVAGRVAQALVDHLEPVEVEQDQRDPGRGARRRLDLAARVLQLLGEPVEEQRPVGQRRSAGRGAPAWARRADLGLGPLEEPGVVERDRRQLAEPRERLDLALARTAARRRPTPGRSRRAPRRPRCSGTAHDRAEQSACRSGTRVRVGVVVVDHHGSPAPDDLPSRRPGPRQPVAP